MFPKYWKFQRVSGLSIFLLLCLGLLGGPREAAAQGTPGTVHIRIFHDRDNENSCFYELLDEQMARLADQDNFTVKPNDLVHFMAENINAQIVAEPDTVSRGAAYGKMPFAGPPSASAFFLSAGATKGARVRSKTGSKSKHKINISCFIAPPVQSEAASGPAADAASQFTRVRAIPALPAEDSSRLERRTEDRKTADPVEHRRATGGPGMEVDEP
jgi:hypothetical protein